MKKYQCQICGYVYDPEQGDPDNGVPAGTPFEKLPPGVGLPHVRRPQDQFVPED